ncbi:MAG: hypothetical protein ACTJLL_02485 [Anaplasma sp.]
MSRVEVLRLSDCSWGPGPSSDGVGRSVVMGMVLAGLLVRGSVVQLEGVASDVNRATGGLVSQLNDDTLAVVRARGFGFSRTE